MKPAVIAGVVHALFVVVALTTVPVLEFHDGRHFAALAADPLLLNNPVLDHPAYRASRIALPILAAPFALFLTSGVALAIVHVLSVVAGTWAACRLAVRRGRPEWWGAVFAALPGSLIAARTLTAAVLGAAAILLAADAYETGRAVWPWLTLAIFTRETMVLAALGFAVWVGWRHMAIPIGAYVLWVGSLVWRFGWSTPSSTIGQPGIGFLEAGQLWWGARRWSEFVGGAVVLLVVVLSALVAFRRPEPLTIAALLVCLVVPFLGVEATKYAIHTQRFLLLPMAVLALVPLGKAARPEGARHALA